MVIRLKIYYSILNNYIFYYNHFFSKSQGKYAFLSDCSTKHNKKTKPQHKKEESVPSCQRQQARHPPPKPSRPR